MEYDVKKEVKKYYGGKAKKIMDEGSSECECSSCCSVEVVNNSKNYDVETIKGLPKEALSASLGCANPLVFAQLKEGEIVLDLGSGGGIDVLASSKYVGSTGKVYGLDMTDEMLELANKNKESMGVTNVEFIKGFIEDIPLPNKTVDVVMSNCVINLSEDKEKALTEAFRVLKDRGRLAIADIITLKEVPNEIKKDAEVWCGCFAGTVKIQEYKDLLERVGFSNIEIQPVHVYSENVIKEIIERKKISTEININQLDGAFAGALIKAVK